MVATPGGIPAPPDGFTLVPSNIDRNKGAPARIRALVGAARTPEDRLATLRKIYPDAQPFDDDNFIFTDPKTGRPTLYNSAGLDVGDLASIGGEASELAGGVLGAAVAAPPAIAAAIPTGGASLLAIPAATGLGAAGARELFDVTARMGGTEDTRSLPTRLTDTAVTAGANAVGARVGDLAAQGISRAVGAMERYSPGLVSGQQAIADANTIGVMPSAGMATGNRAVQIMENAMANTPGGAGIMQEAAERAMRQMDEAAGRVADNIATGNAPAAPTSRTAPWRRNMALPTPADQQPLAEGAQRVMSPQGAGRTIRDASERAATRFANRREQIDEALYQEVGPDTLVSAPYVRQLVRDLEGELANAPASRGPVLRQALERANAILQDVAPTRSATGQVTSGAGIPFRTLRQIRTDIGRELERPDVSGYTPASEASLRRLYGALSDDIGAAADAAGPRARQLLSLHDRYVRFNRNVNIPTLQRIADTGTDEQAFNLAVTAAKDGGSMLERLRRNFRPEEWDTVAASVFSKLGRANPGQQEASGIMEAADDFSAGTFLTNWSKLSPEAKRALFGGSRYEAVAPEIDALVRSAGRLKDAGKMSNPSGTARNTIAALTVLGAGSQALQGDFQNAGMTVGGAVLAPRVVARLLTSPGFVRWLGTSVNVGTRVPSAWGSRIGQLAAVAKAEPEIRDEIYQYLEALRGVNAE